MFINSRHVLFKSYEPSVQSQGQLKRCREVAKAGVDGISNLQVIDFSMFRCSVSANNVSFNLGRFLDLQNQHSVATRLWLKCLLTLKHSVAPKVMWKGREPKRARQAMGKVKLSTTNWIASAWVTRTC